MTHRPQEPQREPAQTADAEDSHARVSRQLCVRDRREDRQPG
jgi:hypothetical protein